MERRESELAEVTRRAMSALEAPETCHPESTLAGLQPVLRLWRYPSFDVLTSLKVYRPDRDCYALRRVVWNRLLDVQRLTDPLAGLRAGFDPNPSITVTDGEVPFAVIDDLLVDADGSQVALFPGRPVIGLDGETFGVEWLQYTARWRLEWWCEGPTEWRPIIEWAARALDLLVARL